MDEELLDLGVFGAIEEMARATGSESMLHELVAVFHADAPARVRSMRAALAAGDQRTFEREAHTLKGSGASLGARRVSALGARLEERARGGDMTETTGLIALLETAVEDTGKALDARVG